ncbi:unnamed protein product, partial [Mesorhabditis spiculigera]
MGDHAHLRAMEQLEEIYATLVSPMDDELKRPIEKIQNMFRKCLITTLKEVHDLNESVLLSDNVPHYEKISRVKHIVNQWEKHLPFPSQRPTTPTPTRHNVSLTHSSSFPEPPAKSHDSGLHTAAASQQERTFPKVNPVQRVKQTLNVIVDGGGRAWEIDEITLDQSRHGLGFSFAGGADGNQRDGEGCLFVTNVIRGGAAYEDGRLRVNDVILRVNNIDCTQVSHIDARNALMNAGDLVKLTVKRRHPERDEIFPEARTRSVSVSQLNSGDTFGRINPSTSTPSLPPPPPPPQGYNIRSAFDNEPPIIRPYFGGNKIELYKNNGGLGFSISGGVGNEQAPNDAGIFVTRVIPDGSADRDGRLKVGDKILAVDNISLDNVTHNFALDVLRSTGNTVALWVASNPIPAVTDALLGKPQTPQPTPRAFGSQLALNNPISTPPKNGPAEQRRVSLIRGSHGLGFNIIGGENGEPIYISIVHAGGVAEASGNVFKGDLLLGVNGVSLINATHQEAAEVLRNAQNPIVLSLEHRPEECAFLEKKLGELTVKDCYMRALFDFDPSRDVGAPARCMSFKCGDILHITNKADDNWWTARFVDEKGEEGAEGVIPSAHRIEKRERTRRRSVNFNQQPFQRGLDGRRGSKSQLSFSRRFPFVKSTDKIHELAEQEAATSEDPIPTYQTVEKESITYPRPVIILGALSQKINDDLVTRYPHRFSSCVPHTSRPMMEGEQNGKDYYFTSKAQMEQDVRNNRFIEAGTYRDNLYGTSVQSVQDVIREGRHCLLDVAHGAIDRLQRIANIHPITIFVKPSSYHQIFEWDQGHMDEEEAIEQYARIPRLEQQAATKFTYVISNADTYEQIIDQILYDVQRESYPTAWISKPDAR